MGGSIQRLVGRSVPPTSQMSVPSHTTTTDGSFISFSSGERSLPVQRKNIFIELPHLALCPQYSEKYFFFKTRQNENVCRLVCFCINIY